MLTYSRISKALAVLFAIAVLTSGACGSKSESSDAGCQAGGESCSCLSSGGCDDGLICATNLNRCVRLAGTSTGGDTGAGATGSGGTTASGGSTGTGGAPTTGGTTGSGGNGASGSAGHSGTGGTTATGGTKGTGGAGGTPGTGGTAATGGTKGTGGTPATGGATGTGGVTSTSCGALSPSASGNGEFTHYNFGQGTAKGELGDYQTACGYLGTESGQTDTVLNIANTSPAKNTYFAAIPGTNGFDTKNNCGACVQISNNGKTIIATIIDECPYGGDGNNSICQQNPKGELDLSVDAFNQLGFANGNPTGTSWKVVPCPYAGNVIVRVKQSNELYVEGTILAITSVSGPGGSASRTSYGSWHFNSNISSGAQLTLTDAANRMLTVTLSSSAVDQNQDTGKQFPTCQ
jgi:hypothetical protein